MAEILSNNMGFQIPVTFPVKFPVTFLVIFTLTFNGPRDPLEPAAQRTDYVWTSIFVAMRAKRSFVSSIVCKPQHLIR